MAFDDGETGKPFFTLLDKPSIKDMFYASYRLGKTGLHGGIPQAVTRSGLADASFIRKVPPLPETADELCAVARDVHADAGDIYLGARATEPEVKRLSKSGQLAQYPPR
jgi:hypothetical protein